ncbi:low molecular weight protein-tyrosine-phosphatase [Rivihabitans pingtungensis]|uniref:low molecular weight protein-tyrosine-phosphatase n=1 Tax=Rivihabitans pingtungensis TaxID=1054498 RepID=UPI0028A27C26|nr:low molecular weight protein-tyrosine-phosphatase [Rivihabitans pingtungensis]
MSTANQGILLVCMGNICRSPTAEAILRAQLRARGLEHDVQVDSAGTHAYHTGEAPDARARQAAQAAGYTLDGMRARQVLADDFARFDWILAADAQNLAELRRRCPAQWQDKLRLMRDWAGGGDVPDPYYGGAQGFTEMVAMLETALAAALDAWYPPATGGKP